MQIFCEETGGKIFKNTNNHSLIPKRKEKIKMPANSKRSKLHPTKISKNNVSFEFEADHENIVPEEAPALNKGRKIVNSVNVASDEDSDSELATNVKPESCENEMQNVLSSFGADITRTLTAKRKRLHSFTQASLKSSNKKYEDIFKVQQAERKKLCDEFSKQITSVYSQWENDIAKSKENEEKLESLLRQQQKSVQQNRVVLSQRIKALKQLHEQYNRSLVDLDRVHLDQHTSAQGEIKKELAQLQKKMLMDTQQEEISNVRKSLQTMLAQV